MPAKKPKTIRVIAAELGMSLGHVRDAMKQGIDPRDVKAMKAFKASRRPRVDDRADMSAEPKPAASSESIDPIEMSLEDFERAIRRKDITVAEATVLKRQIEAMKQLVAVRREARQLLSLDAVKQRDIRIGAAVGAAMRAFETEIPQLCLGLSLERSRPIIKEAVRKIQQMLSDKFSEFWNENQELQ